MANCYDYSYNDGAYTEPGSDYNLTPLNTRIHFVCPIHNTIYNTLCRCYDQGQHCWDNECHNGTVCICDDTVKL